MPPPIYLPFGVIFPLAVGFPQIQPRISHVEGITYVSFITHGSLDVSAPCNAQLKGSKKKKIPEDEYPVNLLENNSEYIEERQLTRDSRCANVPSLTLPLCSFRQKSTESAISKTHIEV